MRLSVIIVSYNVYPFLDNCLRSVQQAMKDIDGEIIVVDNSSVDRTPQLVQEHFPTVRLIANIDNKGFAKANNQALALSTSEYVVLLNPDTIVSEDTFTTCLHFMDNHPEAGAVGVRMLDGSGRFLPESKRGLPTLLASFMKMSGLYKLFPRSAKLNSYYAGHIGEHETAKIQVLTGAFMFMRKMTVDKIGTLDEDYFMYGEDIDLSYRITKGGYAIYYLPTTSIIHYKGESTRKSSLNYILTFYQAMLIFNKKHPEFKGQKQLIKLAIYFHGLVRLLKGSAEKWWPVILDIILFFTSFYFVSKLWERYYFAQQGYFKPSFYLINIPLYTLTGSIVMFLNGAYDKPYSYRSSWVGFGWSALVILVIYAFLPAGFRTSRMVILMGLAVYVFLMWISRKNINPWRAALKNDNHRLTRKAIIIAGPDETKRIKELINRSRDQIEIIGTVSPIENMPNVQSDSLGHLSKLDDIIRVHKVGEIIFSAQDVPFSMFTDNMTHLGPGLRYMLAASTTMNIVGSMNRDTEGESYAIRVHFNLSDPASLRAKRIFDLLVSLLFLFCSPILIWLILNRNSFFPNLFRVLMGKRTWISYHPADQLKSTLPPLPQGILSPVYPDDNGGIQHRLEHIHYVYARDYHWTTDFSILFSQWKKIGQTPLNYG
ncbi:MAG: glycosyltransferase [Saprospiraceae bacterium]